MLYRTVFLAAVMFFFCKAGAGEVFSIQFATRSDFISLGTLFVLPEDNGPALRLVLKNDSVVPAPAPGTGVLCYESVYAPVPEKWQEHVRYISLARRDAVIWRDVSAPLTGLSLEEARAIFSGKDTSFMTCSLKSSDIDGCKPVEWLLGNIPLSVLCMEFDSPAEVEAMVAGNDITLGLAFFRSEPSGAGLVPVPVEGKLPGDDGYILAGEYRLYFLPEEVEKWQNFAEIFQNNLNSGSGQVKYYSGMGIFLPVEKEEITGED